jgi:hypothetical protein
MTCHNRNFKNISTKPDRRKGILILAAVGITVSVLFPPWLYIFNKSSTRDDAGGHWEVSAGYACIFKPPDADVYKSNDEVLASHWLSYKAQAGVKLDVPRLLVEWACILALSGIAWAFVRLGRERPSEAGQKAEGGGG